MSLTAEELDEVRGLTDPIQLSEVEDIYLPYREYPAHPRQGRPRSAQGSRPLGNTSPATAILRPEP
jgi:pantothenate kinase